MRSRRGQERRGEAPETSIVHAIVDAGSLDLERFRALGLYDPASPRAGERAALLAFLVERGYSEDDMLEADGRGRLFGLAGDRILFPSERTLELRDLADQLGAPADVVEAYWEALGLDLPDDDGVVTAAPRDVEALEVLAAFGGEVGVDGAVALGRVVARAMETVAEAGSAIVRRRAESSTETADEVTVARRFFARAQVVARFPTIFRAVLPARWAHVTRQFQQSGSYDVAGRQATRLAVGFFDLTGFTAISGSLELDKLAALLEEFERRADAVSRRHGARVVKFVGDAAMVVAPSCDQLALVADALVDRTVTSGSSSVAVRGGLAHGELLSRDGDYFGPAVNLAARLAGHAEPGAAVTTEEFASGLSSGEVRCRDLGTRTVRGFPQPVAVYRLERTESTV